MTSAFDRLQRERLVEAWRADLAGSLTPRVMIGLPSYSVDRTLLEHYGDRVTPLENRYVYAVLTARAPAKRVVYLSSMPVQPDVLEGYLGLLDDAGRAEVAARSRIVSPEDSSRRSLAEKLLDRGDLIDELRAWIGDDPAVIEPWNVTEAEADLAVALDAPLHGAHPDCRTLATKSNGRRLLRAAGVPVPDGSEDVRSPADVAAVAAAVQRRRPDLGGFVVKLDDSVAGDGNIVVRLANLPADPTGWPPAVEAHLPEWYRQSLRAGGVVEELVEGEAFRSPSAQATITPEGEVVVLATHEQRLGGPNAQVYEGCSFPADPAYAPTLGHYAEAVGRALAAEGAIGRFAVDFVARRRPSGEWDVFGIEINLRKGGTTHPYGITRVLTEGTYDVGTAVYFDRRGRPTFYGATDNLVDESWVGRPPADVRAAIARAGLGYDADAGVGVVPHLLDCLAVDGRMGYTAIAGSPAQVAEIEERLAEALR